MDIWGITDRGVVREENQDAIGIEILTAQRMLAVVCDGMGGARAGHVASTMALERFIEQFKAFHAQGELTAAQMMEQSMLCANEAVFRHAQSHSECYGMGTTMVAALADREKVDILNVGDSRAYLITGEGIARITRDHSLVEDLVLRGELTAEEARVHPNKNLITRALGAENQVQADLFSLEVAPGSYLLLCSDGLSNVVSDQEMLYEVLHGGEADSCCRRLLEIAIKRGAPDNVSVALIQC